MDESTPELTRRERDVLVELCRPVLEDEVFTEPASVREIAASLVVTDAAVKQHLLHLYDKFGIAGTGERRRVRLAREAIRRGAVDLGRLHRARAGDALASGRAAFERHEWSSAVELLSAADDEEPLEADDLTRLGEACLWADRHDESFAAHQRAQQAYLRAGEPRRAAYVALLLTIHYAMRLDLAVAGGWYAKAQRLLEEEAEGPEHGYLGLVTALLQEASGAWPDVLETARTMHEIGDRYGDLDLKALGFAFRGLALTHLGEIAEGEQLLDEAMAHATGGELGLLATGIVYCRMICACLDLHDYRRAGEWTEVVDHCAATSDRGGFPGDCRTHRVAVLVKRGDWAEGEKEALRAVEEARTFHLPHAGAASYELGEIRLRRGDLDGAEEAFLRAHEHGFAPQPGMALVRLARGDVDAAASSIEAALAEPALDRLARSPLLSAAVEIALAEGDDAAARTAVAELEEAAEIYGTPAFCAAAEQARGELELATGDPAEAASRLASAQRLWRQARAPYEAARAGVSLGGAQAKRGHREAGLLELRAARSAFERLGARLDAERIDLRLAALDP